MKRYLLFLATVAAVLLGAVADSFGYGITINPGWNFIVNHHDFGVNPPVSTVLADLQNQSPGATPFAIYKFDATAQAWTAPATWNGSVWGGNLALTMNPGAGAALLSPMSGTFTLNINGGVVTPSLPLGLTAGNYYLIGRQDFGSGNWSTIVGTPEQPNDTVYRFVSGSGWQYNTFDPFDEVWFPLTPYAAAGESVFVRSGGGTVGNPPPQLPPPPGPTPPTPGTVTGLWNFDQGDLQATIGAPLEYRTGPTVARTSFGSTTSFGIADIAGTPAQVMRFDGASTPEAGFVMRHLIPPNGGGLKVNEWTLLMDVLFPHQSNETWFSFAQIDDPITNTNDGDLFAHWTGDTAGIGISGRYHGELRAGQWHRVAFAVSMDPTNPVISKFIDGVKVADQTNADPSLAADGRFALNPLVLLFGDDNGESQPVYVNSVQIRDGKLSDEDIAALGIPDPNGVPVVPLDLTPPKLFSAEASCESNKVTLTFSETVTGAGNPANYAISGGVTVLSVVLSADGYTVCLFISPLTQNVTYTLTVSGVQDLAGNPITPGSTIHFACDPPCANSQTFLSLYSGRDSSGLLGAGASDLQFTLGGPGNPPANPVVIAPVNSLWLANGPNSQWIGPSPAPGNGSSGTFYYTNRFYLACSNIMASQARITGRWSGDDTGSILLNGNATGINLPPGWAFKSWHPVNITSGFLPGWNELVFCIINGPNNSPTGLRVEVRGAYCEDDCNPHPCDIAREWNTGIAGPGQPDPNYTLVSAPSGGPCNGPAQWVTPDPAWAPNSAISSWIGAGPSTSCQAGVYHYRLCFTLLCTNGASITGRWTVDNAGAMFLNGLPVTSLPDNPLPFPSWHPVSITSGFTCGLNCLDFYVTNLFNGTPVNPTGLRAELKGCFNDDCCPPPVVNAIVLSGANGGGPLPAGVQDPQFTLTSAPVGVTIGVPPVVIGNPHSLWAPNGNSKWIGPTATANAPAGTYCYTLQFEVPCPPGMPIKGSLTGRWTADDWAVIELNGTPTGHSVPSVSNPSQSFAGWHPINITSGFQSGLNTLTFYVTNAGSSANPTGLRLELTNAFSCCECAGPCTMIQLPNLYSGIDKNTGLPLAGNSLDPQFSTGIPPFGTINPFVPASIHGAWLPNAASPLSQWIGPVPGFFASPSGVYAYTNRFWLCSANKAKITGRWTVDDSGSIWLNGSPTPAKVPGIAVIGAFSQWHNVNLNPGNSFFVQGWNELVFYVTNTVRCSVTGLRTELRLMACCEDPCLDIHCPANRVEISACGAPVIVNYPLPTVTPLCSNAIVSVTCVPPSGSLFPLGVTTVLCTATDNQGHSAGCSFTVTVQKGMPCDEPNLSITPLGDTLVLSWPAAATNFALEATESLSSPNPTLPICWTRVIDPVDDTHGRYSVTVPKSGAQRFFRLRGPAAP